MNRVNHILVVDDNESIHTDIESILMDSISDVDVDLQEMEDELFGDSSSEKNTEGNTERVKYDIKHAYQGEEALEMVEKAEKDGYPFSLAFMDVRMPPGMDGIQTIQKIWENNPNTEIVICTAYSDYSWDEIVSKLGTSDKLLFMKKPFDATALKQTALSVTTKWKLQQEALKYTDRLEKQVTERTQELAKLVSDYKIMKEKAERASAAKSDFLANVSHEIRTPMMGIIGMNSLLLECELEDEQKEYAEMVNYSAEALMNILNDILDLAKVEAGKVEVEEIPFELKERMEELHKLVEFSSKEKEVEILSTIDDRISGKLIGDPMRIRQILLNFGNNAIKFTDKGKIEFGVKVLDENEQELALQFTVTDSGIGIPKEKQDLLFKPFTQADSSTTRKYGGTGLGLAICKQLAELMGGEVGVESTEGEGSTFWLKLNLRKNGVEKQEKIETGEMEEAVEVKFPPNTRILIAEDNSMNQVVLQKMLEGSGLQVDLAANGKEAIEAVEKFDYDIILMDVHMPEVDGMKATMEIRNMKHKDGKKIPIIALSAGVMPKDKEKISNSGMNDFIPKPISKNKMIFKIKHWLDKAGENHSSSSAQLND